jgi:regulator of replication initiation timing
MTTAPSVIFSEFKTLNKNLDEFLNRYFQLLNGEEIKRLKEENAKLKGEIETLKNALENRELRIKQLHKAIVNEEIQKIMEERKKRNT